MGRKLSEPVEPRHRDKATMFALDNPDLEYDALLGAAFASFERVRAENVKLRDDLKRHADAMDGCEGCGAPLFDGDDYIGDDCYGCWATMTDDPAANGHPCYAYRVGKPDARAKVGGRP